MVYVRGWGKPLNQTEVLSLMLDSFAGSATYVNYTRPIYTSPYPYACEWLPMATTTKHCHCLVVLSLFAPSAIVPTVSSAHFHV